MEAQKKAEDTLGKTVQTFFGFGLSRLIGYSYGGFFGILVALVVSTGRRGLSTLRLGSLWRSSRLSWVRASTHFIGVLPSSFTTGS
jgi:hypothetical protein